MLTLKIDIEMGTMMEALQQLAPQWRIVAESERYCANWLS